MRKLTIKRNSGNLILEWPWKTKGNMFLIVFGVVWNVMALFMAFGILAQEGFNPVALLPLSFHLAIGVFILYSALARQYNRTVVKVGHQQLSVDIGPLPWFGKKTIRSSELRQLFVIESGSESSGSKKTTLYTVKAVLSNKKKVTIVRGIRSRERGLEIEKLIESHLGIKDAPVASGYEQIEEKFEEKFKQYFPDKPVPPLPGPINDKNQEPGLSLEEISRQTTGIPRANDGFIPPPRTSPTDLTDPLANGTGSIMSLRKLNYQLAEVTQFDWENDTIDRSGELLGTNEETGFYSEDRDTHHRYYFEERSLSPKEYLRIGIGNASNMPQHFTNGDEKYHLRESVKGFAHPEGRDSYAVRQWLYFTTASHTRFRVIESKNGLEVYIQEPVALKELA